VRPSIDLAPITAQVKGGGRFVTVGIRYVLAITITMLSVICVMWGLGKTIGCAQSAVSSTIEIVSCGFGGSIGHVLSSHFDSSAFDFFLYQGKHPIDDHSGQDEGRSVQCSNATER
jgi:hypothetical protein